MQTLKNGVESLSLLARLNADRFLVVGSVALALAIAAYMVSL